MRATKAQLEPESTETEHAGKHAPGDRGPGESGDQTRYAHRNIDAAAPDAHRTRRDQGWPAAHSNEPATADQPVARRGETGTRPQKLRARHQQNRADRVQK